MGNALCCRHDRKKKSPSVDAVVTSVEPLHTHLIKPKSKLKYYTDERLNQPLWR